MFDVHGGAVVDGSSEMCVGGPDGFGCSRSGVCMEWGRQGSRGGAAVKVLVDEIDLRGLKRFWLLTTKL